MKENRTISEVFCNLKINKFFLKEERFDYVPLIVAITTILLMVLLSVKRLI